MQKEITFNWDFLGARLAVANSDEQALFFKGFAHEIASWGTSYQIDMQMFAINKLLDKKTKEILENHLTSIFYKEEA